MRNYLKMLLLILFLTSWSSMISCTSDDLVSSYRGFPRDEPFTDVQIPRWPPRRQANADIFGELGGASAAGADFIRVNPRYEHKLGHKILFRANMLAGYDIKQIVEYDATQTFELTTPGFYKVEASIKGNGVFRVICHEPELNGRNIGFFDLVTYEGMFTSYVQPSMGLSYTFLYPASSFGTINTFIGVVDKPIRCSLYGISAYNNVSPYKNKVGGFFGISTPDTVTVELSTLLIQKLGGQSIYTKIPEDRRGRHRIDHSNLNVTISDSGCHFRKRCPGYYTD